MYTYTFHVHLTFYMFCFLLKEISLGGGSDGKGDVVIDDTDSSNRKKKARKSAPTINKQI